MRDSDKDVRPFILDDEENELIDQIKDILKLVIPTFILFVSVNLQNQINVIFVGKTGDTKMMSGIGMAKLLYDMLPSVFVMGFSGTLETLVS